MNIYTIDNMQSHEDHEQWYIIADNEDEAINLFIPYIQTQENKYSRVTITLIDKKTPSLFKIKRETHYDYSFQLFTIYLLRGLEKGVFQ